MSPKGVHFIVEASGCGEVITDVVRLQDILVEAAKQANAQVWSVSFNRFPPNGVSGVVVISESHLSVHIAPCSTNTPEYRTDHYFHYYNCHAQRHLACSLHTSEPIPTLPFPIMHNAKALPFALLLSTTTDRKSVV